MAYGRRAATIRESVANVESDSGLNLATYVIPLDRPSRLYRWAAGDILTPDSVCVLDHSGGVAGNWLEVVEDDQGADLTDANATIQVGGDRWRVLPAATLSGNRVLTLGTTNAQAGHQLTITRLDAGAFTYAIANGGAGAGTLITFPVSSRYWARLQFDGTNWLLRAAGAMAS
jgi:hypothetical protein